MTKINKLYWVGFSIILALPILTLPPYFFPADFGKTIVFRSIMAVLLVLCLYQFFFRKDAPNLPDIKKNKIIGALGALLAVYFIATLFSVDSYFSFWGSPSRGGGFMNFACYIIFAILAFITVKKEGWPKLWNFSIFIGMLVSLVAIIQYYSLLSSFFLPMTSRPASTMGNPILLAIYLLLLFFITLSLVIREKILWKKAYYGAALLLFSYVILLTGTRAAYLGILIGGIYFFLFYPVFGDTARKKIRTLRVVVVALLVIVGGVIFYVNTNPVPQFLQQNRLAGSILPRLSLHNFLEDSRFDAFGIEFNAVKAKPLLGYGIENFSVGFDKYYNATPSLFGIVSWWDRAHNIVMQTLSDAGILGLIAYLALFVIVFWQLRKVTSLKESPKNALMAHGVQATLIAYFVALLFSFDSFSTYLIFFLLIGYSLHLIYESQTSKHQPLVAIPIKNVPYKKIILGAASVLLVWFLWQYNFLPFTINAKINESNNLVNQKNCSQGLGLMESALAQHSFLDSYARLEYGEFIKNCADFYPQNTLTYEKKGLELIGQAVKIQPLYTRYWIFLGSATNDLAAQEQDAAKKTELIKQATDYLNQALKLAPKHQEIMAQQAKVAITAQDFAAAKGQAEECIAINTGFGECYFYLALAQIYTKNVAEAQANLQTARQIYGIDSTANLQQLGNAYGSIGDYQDLVLVYEKLVSADPAVAQYHSSLAFFYYKLGRYTEARQEALKTLELSPESKPNVDAFLKTLPR